MSIPVEIGMGPPRGDDRPPAPPLTAAFHETAQGLIARYPEGRSRSALLPLLYLAQSEQGYVSNEAMGEIARLLDLSRAEVAGVATFYTMFKRAPQGKWLVSVCTQPSCAMAGAREIVTAIEEELGTKSGTTASDGTVSIEEVECLCACDGAPVVSVNYDNYYGVTPEQAVELVRALREGRTPPPSAHGSVPADFAATNRRFAGVDGPSPRTREPRA